MKRSKLPLLLGAGIFDSRKKFSEDGRTSDRTVINYEIELFDRAGIITYLNDKKYCSSRGSVLIAKPGDRRSSQLHFSCYYVHFIAEEDEIGSLLNSLAGYMTGLSFEELKLLFVKMQNHLLSGEEFSDIFAAGELLSLLARLKNHHKKSSESGANLKSAISLATHYIQEHYADQISIAEIAQAANVSSSYLHKLFLKNFSETPNNYLINTRITAAKALLLTTDLSFAEIAERCGFASQTYFCYCFKNSAGLSPGKFRSLGMYPGNDSSVITS